MKTKMVLMLLTVLSWGVAACDKDDSDSGQPDNAVQTAFEAKYPGAADAEWKQKGDYSCIDFQWKGQDKEAWFYKNGGWLLTVSHLPFSSLPRQVIQAVAQDFTYASWTPDREAEILEQALSDPFYIVEVSKAGNTDRDLYYTSEGNLRREVVEDFEEGQLPAAISAFLAQHYPQALVFEGERWRDEMFSVYFFQTGRVCTALFDREQQWQYTSWPVAVSDIPAAVLNTLQGEAYKDFQIQTVEYRQVPAREYYYFHLSREGYVAMPVKIYPDGQLVLN